MAITNRVKSTNKENKENKIETKDEYVVPVATEEKADVSHFTLLKVRVNTLRKSRPKLVFFL